MPSLEEIKAFIQKYGVNSEVRLPKYSYNTLVEYILGL